MEQTIWQPNKDLGFLVYGINSGEGADKAAEVAANCHLTFPVLLDVSNEVFHAYQPGPVVSTPFPLVVLIDGEQVVRYIAYEYNPEAVVQTLNQLLP